MPQKQRLTGNLARLDGGRGKGLGGDDGEPVAVGDEHLHDARVDGAENGLGDDGEVHGVRLLAHLGALEAVLHLESEAV